MPSFAHSWVLLAIGIVLAILFWYSIPDSYFLWLESVPAKWVLGLAIVLILFYLVLYIWQIAQLEWPCRIILFAIKLGTLVGVVYASSGLRAQLSVSIDTMPEIEQSGDHQPRNEASEEGHSSAGSDAVV